jgi:hypothetical protein
MNKNSKFQIFVPPPSPPEKNVFSQEITFAKEHLVCFPPDGNPTPLLFSLQLLPFFQFQCKFIGSPASPIPRQEVHWKLYWKNFTNFYKLSFTPALLRASRDSNCIRSLIVHSFCRMHFMHRETFVQVV